MLTCYAEELLLREFRSFYEKLLQKTIESFNKGYYLKTVELISATALFAWQNHSGVFSESILEDMILKIGEELDSLVPNSFPFEFQLHSKCKNQRRVLHVATKIFHLGGHSRLITSWAKNDPDNQHYLVVTDQIYEIPKKIVEPISNYGGSFTFLPIEKTLLERAAILRNITRDFDFIILHHHPSDIIPLVAFAANQTPPVAIMNHADHVFWLGASIADLVIELRDFGIKLSKQRRKAKNSLILPIPLTINESKISREEARQQLNISENEIVLLSIGAEYKYLRSKVHDFSATAIKILENNPQAVIYLIGANFDEEKFWNHERLHFLGNVPDPTLYQQAADIYLEGFPVGSLTALLETAAQGVCPVLMYAPNELVSLGCKMALQNCEKNACDEAGYIEQVSKLINNSRYRKRIGDITREGILDFHSGKTWQEHLNQIYNFLEKTKHSPRSIEETNFMINEEDLFLVEIRNNVLQFSKEPLWYEWITTNTHIRKSLTQKELLALIYGSCKIKDVKFLIGKFGWQHFTRFIKSNLNYKRKEK